MESLPASGVLWQLYWHFLDKGYLSQPLFEELYRTFGIQLITKLKKQSSGSSNQMLRFPAYFCTIGKKVFT
jgi:hypothetical protein